MPPARLGAAVAEEGVLAQVRLAELTAVADEQLARIVLHERAHADRQPRIGRGAVGRDAAAALGGRAVGVADVVAAGQVEHEVGAQLVPVVEQEGRRGAVVPARDGDRAAHHRPLPGPRSSARRASSRAARHSSSFTPKPKAIESPSTTMRNASAGGGGPGRRRIPRRSVEIRPS
jgi:hypothetical protein